MSNIDKSTSLKLNKNIFMSQIFRLVNDASAYLQSERPRDVLRISDYEMLNNNLSRHEQLILFAGCFRNVHTDATAVPFSVSLSMRGDTRKLYTSSLRIYRVIGGCIQQGAACPEFKEKPKPTLRERRARAFRK